MSVLKNVTVILLNYNLIIIMIVYNYFSIIYIKIYYYVIFKIIIIKGIDLFYNGII